MSVYSFAQNNLRRGCCRVLARKQKPLRRNTVFRVASTFPVGTDATAVIVGGGIVGASVAYHLAKCGLKNVVLLEARTLVHGSTQHPTGLVTASHPMNRYKPILSYSARLYEKLQYQGRHPFVACGTVRLATSQPRLEDFKRYVSKDYCFTGDTCQTHFVTPDQIKQLCPLIDTTEVLGGLHTIGDGYADTVCLTHALVDQAKTMGAHVEEHCPVKSVTLRQDGRWDVATDQGTLTTVHLVNAAGLWARDFAVLMGISDLPLMRLQHQYARIGPVAEIGQQKNMPIVIDHDGCYYLRQDGDHVLLGAFEDAAHVIAHQDWYGQTTLCDETAAAAESNWSLVEGSWTTTQKRLPCLNGATVVPAAGVFSATPDGFPLVGPIRNLPNLWIATGFFDGIACAGGVGKYLSDWMVNGEAPLEFCDADPDRFAGWVDKEFALERSKESYSPVYNWGYEPEESLSGRPTKRVSGIYGALVNQGAHMIFQMGWETPAHFALEDETQLSALTREYLLATNKCAVCDMSFKGKIEVKGPDAAAFLDRLLTIPAPELYTVRTGLMLTPQGHILASMKVFHHDQFRKEFILLTDPGHETRDIRWMKHVAQDYEVDVNQVSEYLSSLGIIGPNSREVLQLLTAGDMSDANFPHRTTKLVRLGQVPVIACRYSASGELGYELFHNRADSLKLYTAVKKVGERFGMTNLGLNTLNTLRMEKGYKIWGKEFSLDTNPIDCGLMELVDLSKEHFIGKLALEEILAGGKPPEHRLELIQLDTLPEGVPAPVGKEVLGIESETDGRTCGQVTSGCFSIKLHRHLCFAWLDRTVSKETPLYVRLGLGDVRVPAQVLETPPDIHEYEHAAATTPTSTMATGGR